MVMSGTGVMAMVKLLQPENGDQNGNSNGSDNGNKGLFIYYVSRERGGALWANRPYN